MIRASPEALTEMAPETPPQALPETLETPQALPETASKDLPETLPPPHPA